MMDEKNPYLMSYGHALARANQLSVAVVVLSVVCIGLVGIDVSVIKAQRSWRPLVIRVDEVGRAQAFRLDDSAGSANDRDLQVYLAKFVQLYYGRSPYTLATDLPSSLYFLDAPLAHGAKLQWSNEAKTNQDPEAVTIDIMGVIIRSMPSDKARGEAEVDYRETIKSTSGQRQELYTARMSFAVMGKPPSGAELINPWGIVISTLETQQDYQSNAQAQVTQ